MHYRFVGLILILEGLIQGGAYFWNLTVSTSPYSYFSESNRWVPPSEGGQDTVPVSRVRVVEVD